MTPHYQPPAQDGTEYERLTKAELVARLRDALERVSQLRAELFRAYRALERTGEGE